MTRSLDEINTDIEATQKRIAEIRKLLNPNPIDNMKNIEIILRESYIAHGFKNLKVKYWSCDQQTFLNIIHASFDSVEAEHDIISLDISKKLRAIGYMAVTVNPHYLLLAEI